MLWLYISDVNVSKCFHFEFIRLPFTSSNWSTSSISPGISDKALNIWAEFSSCLSSVSVTINHWIWNDYADKIIDEARLPFIFNIPNVIWNRTIDPSNRKRSHMRRSIFMCTTDANRVKNQWSEIRLSSISCWARTRSRSGRKLVIKVRSTRWSAWIPANINNSGDIRLFFSFNI